jgi:amino acid transporter
VIDVLLTGLSILLEFAALVALRIREPDLVRPYRVPGGLVSAIALGALPLLLMVLAVVCNHSERLGPISALQLGGMLIALGGPAYFLRRPSAAEPQAAK